MDGDLVQLLETCYPADARDQARRLAPQIVVAVVAAQFKPTPSPGQQETFISHYDSDQRFLQALARFPVGLHLRLFPFPFHLSGTGTDSPRWITSAASFNSSPEKQW